MRSTTARLFIEHCPHALDLHDAGAPQDRDVYATGIAAHAALQALGDAAEGRRPPADLHAVAGALMTQGRSFDGVPEPPLPPAATLEGVALARAAWETWPWQPGGQCEIGLAIDTDGAPCAYSPAAMARGVVDVLYPAQEMIGEDEYEGWAIRDYKSSWKADADDLDSLQLRLYAVMVRAHHPSASFIRVEIANLRTLMIHQRTIWLDETGHADLDRWLDEARTLSAACAARPRLPRPGAGCLRCPYRTTCEHAHRPDADAAERLAQIEIERAALRAALADGIEHPIPGGYVGYAATTEARPLPDAMARAARIWHGAPIPGAPDPDLDGRADVLATMRAWSAVPRTVATLTTIAAALYPRRSGQPYKDQRAAFLDALTARVTVPVFGIHRRP